MKLPTKIKPVFVVPNFLTVKQCDDLVKLCDANIFDYLPGTGGKKLAYSALSACPNSGSAARKIVPALSQLNTLVYGQPQDNVADGVFYLNRYSSDQQAHRGWHVDGGPNNEDPMLRDRRLSVAIQLTDPDQYTGGDIEFMPYHMPSVNLRRKGTALFFPAHEWHRVTPIITGTRYSLVGFTNTYRYIG